MAKLTHRESALLTIPSEHLLNYAENELCVLIVCRECKSVIYVSSFYDFRNDVLENFRKLVDEKSDFQYVLTRYFA